VLFRAVPLRALVLRPVDLRAVALRAPLVRLPDARLDLRAALLRLVFARELARFAAARFVFFLPRGGIAPPWRAGLAHMRPGPRSIMIFAVRRECIHDRPETSDEKNAEIQIRYSAT
jgi:hypothetical protein